MPVAVKIADTAVGTFVPEEFSYSRGQERSGIRARRSEGVSPAETGTVRREIFCFVNQPNISQLTNHVFTNHFSNGIHPRCFASRTDCAPFALPHFSETPMPEEANGNQTRQY